MKSKIIYLCSSISWGGLEMNHLRNAVWMRDRGHQVLVIGIANSPFLLKALKLNLPVQTVPKYRKYYAFFSAFNLYKLLRKENATHLFIRDTRDMSIMASLKFLYGKKIRAVYFMEMQLGVTKKNIFHSIRFSYLDFWSCPLPGSVKQVKEKTNCRHDKILMIPSGLDLSKLSSISSEIARKKMDLPQDKLIFGLIGRLDPQKGQQLLLEAMRLSIENNFDVLLLGDSTVNEGDTYRKMLLDFIEENGLHHRVHLRPFMEDVSVFFSAIDWMVMATKAETFGMVSIESMACGTPVLGSNAGGTPELLENGKLGVLFETLNANDLSGKIAEIVKGAHPINSKDLTHHVKQFDHFAVSAMVEDRILNH